MDYLKTRAPFWKKEETPDGARWVEARASDDDAAARWRAPPESAAEHRAGRRDRLRCGAWLDPAGRVGYRRGP